MTLLKWFAALFFALWLPVQTQAGVIAQKDQLNLELAAATIGFVDISEVYNARVQATLTSGAWDTAEVEVQVSLDRKEWQTDQTLTAAGISNEVDCRALRYLRLEITTVASTHGFAEFTVFGDDSRQIELTSTCVNQVDFSTNGETDTGVDWVDGERIYQQTFNLGALPNATTNAFAHSISSIGQVVNFEGWAYNATDSRWHPILNRVSTSLTGVVGRFPSVYVDATNVTVKTWVDLSACTRAYVTIWYTKG